MFRFFLLCSLAALTAAKFNKLQLDRCGGEGIRINEIDLSPMPLRFPGSMTLKIDADVTKALKGPIKAKIQIWSSTWVGWIKIPLCIKNIGSCTYDVCDLLSKNKDGCPKEVTDLGLSCTCPFQATHVKYILDKLELPPIPGALSMLANGDYWVKAELFESGQMVSCFDAQITIES